MKYLKRVLAVMLAAAMIFCFAGCKKDEVADNRPDEEKIIGNWTAVLDFTPYMTTVLLADLDLVDSVIPKDTPLCSYVIFEFTKEKCKMYFDIDRTVKSVEAYLEEFKNLLAKDLYRQLSEAGMSAEEADKQFSDTYGVTINEYAELIVAGTMNAQEIASTFVESGTAEGLYYLDEGKLFVAETADAMISAPYYSYSFDNGKLLINGASEETFFSAFGEVGITFPIVFEKN